jgi:hypothetical protein
MYLPTIETNHGEHRAPGESKDCSEQLRVHPQLQETASQGGHQTCFNLIFVSPVLPVLPVV